MRVPYRRSISFGIGGPLRRKDHNIGDRDSGNLGFGGEDGVYRWVTLILVYYGCVDKLLGRILVRDITIGG